MSLSISLALSISPSLCVSLFLVLSPCFFLYLSFFLSLSPFFSLSIFLSLCLSLSLALSLSLFLAPSLSLGSRAPRGLSAAAAHPPQRSSLNPHGQAGYAPPQVVTYLHHRPSLRDDGGDHLQADHFNCQAKPTPTSGC